MINTSCKLSTVRIINFKNSDFKFLISTKIKRFRMILTMLVKRDWTKKLPVLYTPPSNNR